MDSCDPNLPLGRPGRRSVRTRSPSPGPSRDRSDSTATLSDRESSQNNPPASQDPFSQLRLPPLGNEQAPDPQHVVSHPGDPFHPVLPQHAPVLPQPAYPTMASQMAHPQSPVAHNAVAHNAVSPHAFSQEPTGCEQAATPPPAGGRPVFRPAFHLGQSYEIPCPPPPFAPGHEHLLHFPSGPFHPGDRDLVLRNPLSENFRQSNNPRAPRGSDGGPRHTAIRMTVPFPMRCECGEIIDAGESLLGRSTMLSHEAEYLRNLHILRFYIFCPKCHGKMYFTADSTIGELKCILGVSPLSDPAPVRPPHPDPGHPRNVLRDLEAAQCAALGRQSGEGDIWVEDFLARMRRP